MTAIAVRLGAAVSPRLVGALALAGLLLLSAVVRTRALDAPLWIDEGLSIGIASHDLLDIPGTLVQDGSPPLYYLLLHLWIAVFGDGTAAVHALSLLLALLVVPAALWAGWSVAGRRAGWIAAALAATNPFLTYYAQEARMYALALLLSLVAAALMPLVAVEGRPRAAAGLGVCLVLLLYTHNWGLYVTAAVMAAGLHATRAARQPRAARRNLLLVLGSVVAAYLPWAPTLIEQARHTGAPWSRVPGPAALAEVVDVTIGGAALTLILVAAAIIGLAAAVREGGRMRATVLAITAVCALVPILGWLGAQVSPNWAGRYLAVAAGPLILLVAIGLARAGIVGLVACALLGAIWIARDAPASKSNVGAIAAAAAPSLRPGDVVLVTQPEQIALLHHVLPPGLLWWTSLGPSADPRVMDWRDALDRLEAAEPAALLHQLRRAVPSGARVVLAEPIVEGERAWQAPWTRLVRERADQWHALLIADPVRVEGRWPQPDASAPGTSMRLWLLDLGSP